MRTQLRKSSIGLSVQTGVGQGNGDKGIFRKFYVFNSFALIPLSWPNLSLKLRVCGPIFQPLAFCFLLSAFNFQPSAFPFSPLDPMSRR